jgi:hypothetical protein
MRLSVAVEMTEGGQDLGRPRRRSCWRTVEVEVFESDRLTSSLVHVRWAEGAQHARADRLREDEQCQQPHSEPSVAHGERRQGQTEHFCARGKRWALYADLPRWMCHLR